MTIQLTIRLGIRDRDTGDVKLGPRDWKGGKRR